MPYTIPFTHAKKACLFESGQKWEISKWIIPVWLWLCTQCGPECGDSYVPFRHSFISLRQRSQRNVFSVKSILDFYDHNTISSTLQSMTNITTEYSFYWVNSRFVWWLCKVIVVHCMSLVCGSCIGVVYVDVFILVKLWYFSGSESIC